MSCALHGAPPGAAMHVVSAIHQTLPTLSPSEANVGRCVLANLEWVPFASLQALAQRSLTSDATVIRFCISLGYSGFQDFKTSLTSELIERGLPRTDRGTDHRSYLDLLRSDAERTVAGLAPRDLRRAGAAIARAGTVIVIGMAGSAAVADILVAGLLSLNAMAARAADRVAAERLAGLIGTNDVLIGISHSGAAPEVEAAIRRASDRGACTIALTNSPESGLAARAQIPLVTRATERLLGSNACHPRIVQLLVLELLLDVVADAKQAPPPTVA